MPPGRYHPWTQSHTNSNWAYRDFKAQLELIETALEDFVPFADKPAVVAFYALMRWLNGPESIFETNDCGLRPPRVDREPPHVITLREPIVMHSRLTVLFRDLRKNCTPQDIEWLRVSLGQGLTAAAPNFPAVVKVGLWPHLFSGIGCEGHVIHLTIWAWGETQAVAMDNLKLTYEAIERCLRSLSASSDG